MDQTLSRTKAFISYSHVDREHAAQAKRVLAEVGIDAFLAHEDIEVSAEWQSCIKDELMSCAIFVALLSANFLSSKWAPQEVGFIVSRPEVAIAPLSIDGTTPFGFISHLQSGRIPPGGITRELLVEPLARRVPRSILPGLIQIAADSRSFRGAEGQFRALAPYFTEMTPEEAQVLADASISNNQIWSAGRCRADYLPEFIEVQGSNIDPETLRVLQYQVENDEWYPQDYEPKT